MQFYKSFQLIMAVYILVLNVSCASYFSKPKDCQSRMVVDFMEAQKWSSISVVHDERVGKQLNILLQIGNMERIFLIYA